MSGFGGGYNAGGEGKMRNDTLQPVTIKQLNTAAHDAPDDKYVINGHTLGLVTFLGRIMTCELQVTMITLKMDDCTGQVNVVYMIDPEDNEYSLQKREHVKELAWVRVVGNLNNVDGALQVNALHVKGVDDMNELSYHRLEVVRAFLSQTMPRPAATATGTTPVRQGLSKVGLVASQGGGGVPFGGYGGGGSGGAGAAGRGMGGGVAGGIDNSAFDSGMSREMSAVYNYLKQRHHPDDQNGVHVSEIAKNVQGVGSETAIRTIMDSLAGDGHVYSTIDDDHYAFCMA
jgi:replication factor A2